MKADKNNFHEILLKSCGTGIYVAQKGRLRFTNRTLERWLGYRSEELLDSDPMNLIHPDHREEIKRSEVQLLQNAEKTRGELTTEFKALKKKGGLIWFQGKMTIFEYDRHSAIVHSLSDISKWKQIIMKLEESEERFLALSDAAKDAIVIMDHQGRTSYWNPAAARMFNYQTPDIIGKNTHRFLAPLHLHKAFRKVFLEFQKTGEGDAVGRTLELTGKRKGGKLFPIELSLSSVNIKGSWHSLAIIRDITERKERELHLNSKEKGLKDLVERKTLKLQKEILQRKAKEVELQRSEEKYRTLFERVPQGIYRTTPEGRIIDANPALVKMLGFRNRHDLIANRTYSYFADKQDRQRQHDLLKKELIMTSFEIRMRRRDGSVFWARDHARAIKGPEGRIIYYEGILEDITEQKETEERLRQISIRDPLTDIFNRRYIFERLEELIQKHKRDQSCFSVALLDIDHFKQINDIHGHQAGDMILKDFTDILKKKLRVYDIPGRFGGEQFIILFVGSRKEQAAEIIKRILKFVQARDFLHNDKKICFTFSCGIAEVCSMSSKKLSVDLIIGLADKHLYKAKKAGRNQICAD